MPDKNDFSEVIAELLRSQDRTNEILLRLEAGVPWSNRFNGMTGGDNNPFISAWGCTDGHYYKTFMNVFDPTRFAEVVGNIYENPELAPKFFEISPYKK